MTSATTRRQLIMTSLAAGIAAAFRPVRAVTMPSMTSAARIRCFLTARDNGARLTEQATLGHDAGEPELPSVSVDTGRRFQVIEGFGGAFTEAAAVNWLSLGAGPAP